MDGCTSLVETVEGAHLDHDVWRELPGETSEGAVGGEGREKGTYTTLK